MADWKEPKFVQQIGQREEHARVYIEDYVNTFLQKPDRRDQLCLGLLVGAQGNSEGCPVTYLSGAVRMNGVSVSGEAELLPGSLQGAKKEKTRYFGNLEICGWYYWKKPWDNVDFASLEKLHAARFGREGQLFCVISEEGGLRFYRRTGNRLTPLSGYFVYYEKNDGMQAYLIDHEEKKTEPKREPAVERFRTVMKEKQEKKKKKRFRKGLITAAAMLLLAGALWYRGSQLAEKHPQIQSVFQTVQQQFSGLKLPWQGTETGDDVIVQELPGAVYPTEEQTETAAPTESETEVSGTEESSEQETAAETEAAAKPETYTVKKGDTLRSICRKLYGSEEKLSELIELNGIGDPDLLKEGQILKLP